MLGLVVVVTSVVCAFLIDLMNFIFVCIPFSVTEFGVIAVMLGYVIVTLGELPFRIIRNSHAVFASLQSWVSVWNLAGEK